MDWNGLMTLVKQKHSMLLLILFTSRVVIIFHTLLDIDSLLRPSVATP